MRILNRSILGSPWEWYPILKSTMHLTDEETEYLSSLLDKYSDTGDESEHFDMIFTEK